MIEIKHALELGESARKSISDIFADGFGEHLAFFSKDKEKLANALAHMFVLDVFYVALVDGEMAGITACTDGTISSVNPSRQELRKHLGFVKGTIAAMAFKREFQKPPILVGEGIASVEFVATSSSYRGQGVAMAIMNHLFAFPQYKEYVLEVADTNVKAVKLYEKLGYEEFTRIKEKYGKLSGINYRVYMKYSKQVVRQ